VLGITDMAKASFRIMVSVRVCGVVKAIVRIRLEVELVLGLGLG
jgi:hypothetical protein